MSDLLVSGFVFFAILLSSSVREVKNGQVGRLFNQGEFVRDIQPGWVLVFPIIQRLEIAAASDIENDIKVTLEISEEVQSGMFPKTDVWRVGLFVSSLLIGVVYLIYLLYDIRSI